MALVEPLIGHLLSKYKETVLEGLSKIRHAVQAGGDEGHALAVAVAQHEEALQALRATLQRHEYFAPTLQTLTAVLSQLSERGSRVALVRDLLRGECAALFRKTLATLSDATLAHVTAALQFLTVAVKDAPLLVLARLRSPADAQNAPTSVATSAAAFMSPVASGAPQRRADVPLHIAAFRLQLTYNQRRLRLVRLGFLVQLITSPMHNAVVDTMCSHGTLTHLLEDAAELLREGTSAGVPCALSALRVVRELFVESRHITAEQKRRVLLAQRNVFRLLVRALEFEPVADNAAAILYAVVDETIESPADYASTRVESLEDQGMPNYLLFFLLRQLRPKASERMAELVLHILQRAPDLIRPYFIRVSGHLAEEGSSHGVAPSTARVAVLNLMTRAFLLPMPYHLTAQQVRLEPVVAKTATFYTMCPRDVVDEISPMWVAEYVHRLINGSTNLLLLALAMQLTQAALTRAKRVLPLVLAAQHRGAAAAARVQAASSDHHGLTGADLDVLRGTDDAEAEVWDTYNAQVRHYLQSALPSREEFWHRMTQQLHRTLTAAATAASASAGPTSSGADANLAKTQLVVQRMLLLMKDYVDVFDIRAPWLSAVPAFLPDLTRSAGCVVSEAKSSVAKRGNRDAASAAVHPITAALQQHNDVLRPWPAASVALLCELLVASQQRRVPMMKLHHINMSQAVGVGEWPLLLSVLLWVTHHAPRDGGRAVTQGEARAMGWAAQLVLWTVHSVTIHSACTVAEAHLWLTALTPNTVPVFLHVLNHLLMRSLSKAADRVTDELRDATHGVLVAAARHFIERTKEKQRQRAGGAEASQPLAQAAPEHAAAAANLWGTHLHASLAEFEDVVARVVARWGTRAQLLAQAAAVVAAGPADGLPPVTRQQCVEVLVLADRQRGLAKAASASSSPSSSSPLWSTASSSSLRHGSTSQASQLRVFALTLHSPVLPLPGEEAEMALLEQLSSTAAGCGDTDALGAAAQQQPHLSARLVADVCATLGLVSPGGVAKHPPGTAAKMWFTMNSVCWHVAGMLAGAHAELHAAHQLARRVMESLLLLDNGVAVQAHLQASADREGASTGLLVLLLACVRALLRAHAERTPCEPPSPDACAVLGRVCMSVYTGSLAVQDRLLYAICLTLHYLTNTTPATAPEQPHEDVGRHDDDSEETAAAAAEDAAPGAKPRAGRDRAAARTSAPPSRYHGAEVPAAVVQHRFLLMGHTASAARTPELDMLAWHLDTLTEDDITRMALHASSRLHNAVSVASSDSGDAAEALLAAVFPELHTAADADVADLERLALADVLDPRYMVPLVHRVVALPPALLSHLPTGRAIPLLLKALTSVDAALRAAAATALSIMYIPKGALRVVVSVARLKLVQLQSSSAGEGRHRPHSQASPRRASSARVAALVVPRLPTPLAITLITSIRPLGRYDDVLHHHLTHFLLHTEAALVTPLPFAKWATAPPLAALSVPLMLERQEALQQHGGKKLGGVGGGASGGGGVTQASAADVARELRKGVPPQLAFLLQLLRHGCEVPEDGAAVLESSGLEGLMLLCDMLAASDMQRAALVRCLVVLCSQSAALTRLLARSGHVLAWAVAFVWALCREHGTASAHPYSGQTFATALELLRAVVRATAPEMSEAAAEQLQESLRQLRAWVVAAHVTARDVLDVLDEMTLQCRRAARAAASAATAGAESHAPAKAQELPVAPPAAVKKRGRNGEGTRAETKRSRVEGTA